LIGSRATLSSEIAPGVPGYREGEHTTHLSVVDEAGGAVSLTLTLNTWYGSGVVAEETGVLLNCDMDDFTLAPDTPNYFGLVQGIANRIAGGKRMLSAMAPTMVLDSRNPAELLYVLGTPGGGTIPTTTFQILSHLLDRGLTPAEAIAAPRFHHQHLPDRVEYEPGGTDPELRSLLQGMGHDLHERNETIGDVQMVVVEADGARVGYSDPRRGGRPGAY
jgi:gamma-glutamyltranspeptidase/glutathione hydrolase